MMLCLSNTYNRRGAMFGLDARIALAIFAGLGVIAGAMVYKVVTQSRYASFSAEMNNIAKAFGEYMLDAGTAPVNIEDLISSSAAGWNGPYVSYEESPLVVNNSLAVNVQGMSVGLGLIYYADEVWYTDASGSFPCVSGNCWGWLVFTNFDFNGSQIEALDRAIDGEVDGERGRLRFETGAPDATAVLYKLGSVRTAGY